MTGEAAASKEVLAADAMIDNIDPMSGVDGVKSAVPIELVPKVLYGIDMPEKIVVGPGSAAVIDYEG